MAMQSLDLNDTLVRISNLRIYLKRKQQQNKQSINCINQAIGVLYAHVPCRGHKVGTECQTAMPRPEGTFLP